MPLKLLLIFILSLGLAIAQGNFEKGLSYYKQGQYSRAVEEFEQLVQANPEYEDGYRILGDSYLQLRRYDDAVKAFQRALQLKSDNFVSYHGLALAFFNNGRFRDAIAALLRGERYARAPRDQHQLLQLRGSAYFNVREFEKAVADLRKAASIQRGNLQDLLQLGIAHFHMGQLSESEAHLRQALALAPSNEEAQRFLSRIAFQRAADALEAKDYRQAIALLKPLLDRNPQDGDSWLQIGVAYLFLENWTEAESALLNAVRLLPQNAEAHERLGFVYERRRQYQKSLDAYRKAHELNPEPRIQESIERVQERIRRAGR